MTRSRALSVGPSRLAEAPDAMGHFGPFGGRFVPETLMPALIELGRVYDGLSDDTGFWAELDSLLRDYAGRETPLYEAKRLSERLGGARIFLKREDLCHTGAHKINNALGQALLAVRMGKTRLVAETGAGQHGVAVATAAALFGLECVVYMGVKDMERQAPNATRMRLLGAGIEPVTTGDRTLKEAVSDAIRDWVTNVGDTHYVIGSVLGPHPYPVMVRDFQSVIGREARAQILDREGRLPDALVACVGGGSNAMGLFHAFIEDEDVALFGVEAAGKGLQTGLHAASMAGGSIGSLHGALVFLLQDEHGQIREAHSIAAGLDYPGVGPELCFLKESGRVKMKAITDNQAREAFSLLARTEGILPALESAHALAFLSRLDLAKNCMVVVCLSGRGDKDVARETVEKDR